MKILHKILLHKVLAMLCQAYFLNVTNCCAFTSISHDWHHCIHFYYFLCDKLHREKGIKSFLILLILLYSRRVLLQFSCVLVWDCPHYSHRFLGPDYFHLAPSLAVKNWKAQWDFLKKNIFCCLIKFIIVSASVYAWEMYARDTGSA